LLPDEPEELLEPEEPEELLEPEDPDEPEELGDPEDELDVAPLEPEVVSPEPEGEFEAVLVHGLARGWTACGPIPSSPPAGASPDELPPVGAPLEEEVPAAPPPVAVVPPPLSEQPLPLWLPPPESDPEHAVVAAERARTAKASETESFIERPLWFAPPSGDEVNVVEDGCIAHSDSEIGPIPAGSSASHRARSAPAPVRLGSA
jgi:hypothetical protein